MNAVVNDPEIQPSIDDRIVDALLFKGRLKDADLVRARRLQEETGGSLLALLARLGLVADPQDAYTLDAVRLATGREVRPLVALRSEIDDLVERWHGQGRSAMGAIGETAEGEGSDLDDVEHLRDLASEAPVIRLVNLVIQRAVELPASDIHIEAFETRLKVRYRVDGVLA